MRHPDPKEEKLNAIETIVTAEDASRYLSSLETSNQQRKWVDEARKRGIKESEIKNMKKERQDLLVHFDQIGSEGRISPG